LQPEVRVRNVGNRPVQHLDLALWPEGNQPLRLRIDRVLQPGQALDTLLTLTWPQRSSVPYSFFCAEVAGVNGLPDTIEANNRICQMLAPGFVLDALYPVPATEALHVRYATESTRPIMVRVLDSKGLQVSTTQVVVPAPGLHTWRLPVAALATGFYLIELQQGNVRHRRAFQVVR
jgi:hypothetical protein